jgi:hypothetical protein
MLTAEQLEIANKGARDRKPPFIRRTAAKLPTLFTLSSPLVKNQDENLAEVRN